MICSLQCFTNSQSQNFMIFYVYFSILWPIRMGMLNKLVKWQVQFSLIVPVFGIWDSVIGKTMWRIAQNWPFPVKFQAISLIIFNQKNVKLLLSSLGRNLIVMYFAQCTEFDYFFLFLNDKSISIFLNDLSVCKWEKKNILHFATFLWTLQAVIMSRVFIMSYQLAE